MTLGLTCKRCGAEFTAEHEEELVTQVQANVRGRDPGSCPNPVSTAGVLALGLTTTRPAGSTPPPAGRSE
jgi:hypothetical protein